MLGEDFEQGGRGFAGAVVEGERQGPVGTVAMIRRRREQSGGPPAYRIPRETSRAGSQTRRGDHLGHGSHHTIERPIERPSKGGRSRIS